MIIKPIRDLVLGSAVLLATAAIATGCIKDDLAGCPPEENMILHFRLPDAQGNDAFAGHITNTEVAIFTAAGDFVTNNFLYESDLTAFQGIKLKLDPGDYRIVCWGNLYTHSTIDGRATLGQSAILHTQRGAGDSDDDDPMFYAPHIADMSDPDASAFYITIPAQGSVDKTIDFTGAHKTIEVFVKGFEDNASTPVHCPKIEITDLASAYDFSMRTFADQPICFTQRAAATNDPALAASRFHTALFENDTPILVHIKNPSDNAVIWTVDLKQFLTDNNITLTPGGHDLIQIQVEFKTVGVNVTLPNWGGTDVEPEF